MEKLSSAFGFDKLLDEQFRDISALLDRNKSAAAIFPTGAGMSLCFQLSAVCLPNLTLAVCPLIALMKDQVDFLVSRHVKAAFLNSTLSQEESNNLYARLADGDLDLLYVAPERFRNEYLLSRPADVPIDLLAVDEAHCVSERGNSFRPDYLLLATIGPQIKAKRILCTTAAAHY
jgi:ATP-dependent DNA helicase RecQ